MAFGANGETVVWTGFARLAPNRGCRRPAITQAAKSPTPAAAKAPDRGATKRTSQVTPGVNIPETSRKLEYTADISVRPDGLTAIKNGSPP